MNIAIVCNTPYQIVGAINYTYTYKQTQLDCVDLYLGDNFNGFEAVYSKLSAIGLFDNIYVYHPQKRGTHIRGNVERFLNIIFPRRCLNSFLREPDVFKGKKYDKILGSVASYIVVALIYTFPKARVEFYDDGSGSYSRELSYCVMSPTALMINRILGRDLGRISPEKILLNCPEMASDKIKEKVEPLPVLKDAPKELKQIFCSIWDYEDDGYYRNNKCVCLFAPTQDKGVPIGTAVFQEELVHKMPQITDNYLLRLHPRQNAEEYTGCRVDTKRTMWELACADQITDDHVLLADYSTAQMTPKMLYDKEPILIFSYRAYSEGCSEERLSRLEEMIKRLRNSYRRPERIIVPQTKEELWECVRKYCADA